MAKAIQWRRSSRCRPMMVITPGVCIPRSITSLYLGVRQHTQRHRILNSYFLTSFSHLITMSLALPLSPSLSLLPASLPPSLPVPSPFLLSLFPSLSLSHARTHCLSFSLLFYCSRSLFQRFSSDDAHEDAWYAAKIVLPSGRKEPLDELKQTQLTALKAYVNRYALARAY